MSGSRRWFRYTADNGNAYAVELDESNSEATVGGAPLMANLSGGETLLPGRLRMRYVNVSSGLGANQIRRRLWVGSQSTLAAISSGTQVTVGSIIFDVTSTRGETAAIPRVVDSGQTDGDAPD